MLAASSSHIVVCIKFYEATGRTEPGVHAAHDGYLSMAMLDLIINVGVSGVGAQYRAGGRARPPLVKDSA